MIPGAFDYHRPVTLADAIALLSEHGDEARPLAGGHSLIPMMKLRMAMPEHLVDLSGISELRGIEDLGGSIRIGAMTSQADIIASSVLAQSMPILRETSLQIADPQIRSLGTIGGNVANGDPGNDMPAVMLALDASYTLVGPNGSRKVKARSFYEAAYFTSLAEDEILTAITIQAPSCGQAYVKQKRKIGDYATAAAAVIITMEGGRCREASIALTNLGNTPLYAEAAGTALVGTEISDADTKVAAAAAAAITDPASDGRGSSEFRKSLAGVITGRAIALAKSRAG